MTRGASVRSLVTTTLPSGRKAFRVKWRDPWGDDHTRSFRTKRPAEELRSRLLLAVADPRTHWDRDRGVPEELGIGSGGETWWEFLCDYLGHQRQRGQMRSRSFKALADGLLIATPIFTAGELTVGQVRKIRALVLDVLSDAPSATVRHHDEARRLLARRSLRLTEIDDRVVRKLDVALMHHVASELHLTKANRPHDGSDEPARLTGTGSTCSHNTSVRRVAAVRKVLNAAVARRLIASNPLVEVRRQEGANDRAQVRAVQVAEVFGPEQVQAMAELAWSSWRTRHYAALIETIGFAGLRPSECYHLTWADVSLPESGWGEAAVRGGTLGDLGTRWTGNGTRSKDELVKTARAGEPGRGVPLHPRVVAALRRHGELREHGERDRVFVNSRGDTPGSDSVNRIVHRLAEQVAGPTSPLAAATLYDLRHTSVSLCLRAGMDKAEVARRHGHSVAVMERVYANLMPDSASRGNAALEQLLPA